MELYPSDADLNALSGTSDAEQEVLYVATGQSPYYTSFYKMLHRLLNVARRAGDLRVYKDGPLTFGVRAGKFMDGATARNFAGASAQALADNATNYIYVTAGGVLTVNQIAFPDPAASPHLPLATITTSAGGFDETAIVDERARAIFKPTNVYVESSSVNQPNGVAGTDANSSVKFQHSLVTGSLPLGWVTTAGAGGNPAWVAGAAPNGQSTPIYYPFIIGNGGTNVTPVWDVTTTDLNNQYSIAGQYDLFVGQDAGIANTCGAGNTFVGAQAGEANTNGNQNTCIGWAAGRFSTSGYHNTYIGVGAGQDSVTGYYNTYVGCDCGLGATGSGNVAIGTSAYSDTLNVGSNNSAIGPSAGESASGNQNTFIGNNSGSGAHPTLGINTANANTMVGFHTGLVNTSGNSNSFLGWSAGVANTTGSENTFLGYEAGFANTSGINNTFVGSSAGVATTTGVNNIAVGRDSMSSNVGGANNVAVGVYALNSNVSGTLNTALGYQVLFHCTGSDNVGVGYQAGATLASGSNCTFVGDQSNTTLATANNSTAIGAGATVTASNQMVFGNSNVVHYRLPGLPTADPHIVGDLWADAANGYALKVSQG